MKSELIYDRPQMTYLLVLDKDDEAVGSIEGFASENRIAAASTDWHRRVQRPSCCGFLRLGNERSPEDPSEGAVEGRLAPR